MKLGFTLFLMAMVAAFAFAQAPQIPVVVSYPAETPQSVIEEAMEAIKKAGGIITHEYSIIKGFAAKATENALDSVRALSNLAVIEKDQIIDTN